MAQRSAHENILHEFSAAPNAGFANYGETINVDPYTGKLQAGFTLYRYDNKSTGLEHDITIGYQGGGIGVDNLVSNVGIGWSIGAGNTITRMVRGLPDEDSEGGFTTGMPPLPNQYDATRWQNLAQEFEDGEADIYYYGAGANGGRFFMGRNGQIINLPSSNIKIERYTSNYIPSYGPLDSCRSFEFRITKENGVKYVYTKFDCSKLDYGDTTYHRRRYGASTWYLTRIVSPFDKDSILFEYTPVIQDFTSGYSFINYTCISCGGSSSLPDYNINKQYRTRVREMRLTSVSYPNGTVVTFNYDTFKRLDLKTDNALKEIVISNPATSAVYGYRFRHGYMPRKVSTVIPYQSYDGTPTFSEDESNYSLRLDGFHLFSGTDTLPGYGFEYTPERLPGRGYAFNVDHWGFATSTGIYNRIPAVKYLSYDLSGSTRNADSAGSTAGSLQKIVLPTGGHIRLEYELHKAKGPDETVYSKDQLQHSTNLQVYHDDDTLSSSYQKVVPLSSVPSTHVVHRLTITPQNWPANYTSVHKIRLRTWKSIPNNTAASVFLLNKEFTMQDFSLHTPYTVEFSAPKTDTIVYRAVFSALQPDISNAVFSVQWERYSATSQVQPATLTVGGIRIKKMIQSDGMGQSNDMVQEYRYVENSGLTSGIKAGKDPIYHFTYTEGYDPKPTNPHQSLSAPYSPTEYDSYELISRRTYSGATSGTSYNYVVRTGNPLNVIQYTHGSPVGYGRVEIYNGTISNNKGKTVYIFTTPASYPLHDSLQWNKFPYPQPADVDFATGLPLSTQTYNAAGQLLSKQVAQYDVYQKLINDPNFSGVKMSIASHPATSSGNYAMSRTYLIIGKVFKVKTTETSYFQGGDSIVIESSTVYDTAKMVPRYVFSKDAMNNDIVTRYFYPFQFGTSGALATLNSKGIIYSPIRTEVWKGATSPSYLMNAAVSTFSQLGDGSVKQNASYGVTIKDPIPDFIWGNSSTTVLLQNPQYYTKLADLDQYDSYGNLVQSTSKGVTTSSIWDYKKQYPIAHVTNALASDIAYTSFEADGLGGWTAAGINQVPVNTGITGQKGYAVSSSNSLNKSGLSASKKYFLTVWAGTTAPTVKATVGGNQITVPVTASDAHKGWKLYRAEITGATAVSITAATTPVSIDELRLYPEGAAMKTYTYDPLVGLATATDAANRTTYYEYDKFGRLLYQKDVDGNIIKAQQYTHQEAQN